jgi:autotransporter-associated beta strand protein
MNFDSSFPTPLTMIADLKAMGLNTYLWIADRANQELLTVADDHSNYLLTPSQSSATSPAYNLLNPAAYTSFESQLSQLVSDGAVGFKIDRGGEGEMPVAMQNEIPVYFDQLAAQTGAEQDGSNFFDLSRDPNDQARQYTAVWSGDGQTSFQGLATTVQEGVRAGLIGFPLWGSDTGGYTGSPSEDLFARWIEFSAYCPVMEVLQGAGSTNTGTSTSDGNLNRDIWYDYAIPGGTDTSSPLVAILQNQTEVHHDLIPYVQSCMAECMQDGMPIMRAMFLEFPNDPKVANMSSEYMYGPSILVAPVTTAATTVTSGTTNEAISTSGQSVYLPLGTRWVEYDQTLTTLANGQETITTSAPLTAIAGGTTLSLTVAEGTIPTYAREGAIIPRGDIIQDNQTWAANWQPTLHIDFFPSDQITSSFNYYTSSGTTQTIQSSIANNILQIEFGNLQVTGNMVIYMGRFFSYDGINSVSLNGQSLNSSGYSYNSSTEVLTVPFSEATTLDVNISSEEQVATTLATSSQSLDIDGASQQVSALTGVAGTAITLGGGTLTVQDTISTTFAGSINDAGGASSNTGGSLVKQGIGTLTLTGPSSYTGPTVVSSGTLSFAAVNSGIGARVLGALNIGSGTGPAEVTVANSTPVSGSYPNRTVLTTTSLSINTTDGTLDLGSNDLIVHSGASGESVFGPVSTAGTIENLVATGRGTNGAWTGNGIISSAAAASPSNKALAVVLNATNQSGSGALGSALIGTSGFNHGLSTFDGQTVSLGDVLVKYTYYGDALLNGSVTSGDYAQIDNGFNMHLTGWYNGDFNYDGVINGDDYTLIDNAFNSQGGVSLAGVSAGPAEMIASDTEQIAPDQITPSAIATPAVPEPGTLSLIGLGAAGLLARRRRRKEFTG